MLKNNVNDPEATHSITDRDMFYNAIDGKITVDELKKNINLRVNHQWTKYSWNIMDGSQSCRNNCKYCYMISLNKRFNRETEIEEVFKCHTSKVNKGWKQVEDKDSILYMFPSSHDIFPEMVDNYILVAKKIMDANHRILCVTKPNLTCIKKICNEMQNYKDKIKFRFTISTDNDDILKVWETDAPNYKERIKCLKHAYKNGYETSVSMEPFLSDPTNVINKVDKYVTDSIWIGTMSDLDKMNVDYKEIEKLEELYSKENLCNLVTTFRNNKKIFWKISVMKICLL